MEEKLVSEEFGYSEWIGEFHRYCESHSIEKYMENVMSELKKMGWPEEEDPVDFQHIKNILSNSSNKRIRLIALLSNIQTFKNDLKDIYENVMFFLKSDENTKGKIKEEKRKYAELHLEKENLILNKINKVASKISDLSEAYKIKYDSTSRILSIVEYERKQTGRE